MRLTTISVCFCLIFGLMMAAGCSDSGDPSGPSNLVYHAGGTFSGHQTDCGENGFLLSFAPGLFDWETALDAVSLQLEC